MIFYISMRTHTEHFFHECISVVIFKSIRLRIQYSSIQMELYYAVQSSRQKAK